MSERELITLGHTLGTAVMLGAIVLQRKFRQRRSNRFLERELDRTQRRALYLASIIDKSDIEVDEFDLIALREM